MATVNSFKYSELPIDSVNLLKTQVDRQLFSTREPIYVWMTRGYKFWRDGEKKLLRKNLLIPNVAENCIDTLFMILIDISALKRFRCLFSHVVCNAME